MITDLIENFSCTLCESVYIDPVALKPCGHTFCRSCVLKQLEKEKRCPKCACETNTSESFVEDRTLRKIIYKARPDLYIEELLQRCNHYHAKKLNKHESNIVFNTDFLALKYLRKPDELVCVCIEYVQSKRLNWEENMEVGMEQSSSTADADASKAASFRRFFRCEAQTPLAVLRKLLEIKLEVSDSYKLHFFDSRAKFTLDDECEMGDIACIFKCDRKKPLKILFSLVRQMEEEIPPVLDMETMPELAAEEPLAISTSVSVAPTEPAAVPIPSLSVSLNDSMMEAGGSHHPIITTNLQSQPLRKKRKLTSPVKKRQITTPSFPVQRMMGISPLAKGPPQLFQRSSTDPISSNNQVDMSGKLITSNDNLSSSSMGFSSSCQFPLKKISDGDLLASASKDSSKLQGKVNSILQNHKVLSESDRKIHEILSRVNLESESNSPTSISSVSNAGSVVSKSSGTTASSSHSQGAQSNLIKINSQEANVNNPPFSDVPSYGNTQNDEERRQNSDCSPSNTNSFLRTAEGSKPRNKRTRFSVPRPIKPKPENSKNIDAIFRNYGLFGKTSDYTLNNKAVNFPALPLRAPPFYFDKIADQPVKQLLNRVMLPFMGDGNFLRPPTSNFIPYMNMNMQITPNCLGSTTENALINQARTHQMLSSAKQFNMDNLFASRSNIGLPVSAAITTSSSSPANLTTTTTATSTADNNSSINLSKESTKNEFSIGEIVSQADAKDDEEIAENNVSNRKLMSPSSEPWSSKTLTTTPFLV